MSGIAGIYYPDGRPVVDGHIGRMAEAQTKRGPDYGNIWRDGNIAVAHQAMRTTPEAMYERQPSISRQGNLVLTADARIDNREELISLLSPVSQGKRPVTDAELILLSYERWGKECPKYLLGAFAFAIWDASSNQLYCARDHVGIRPLHYHVTPHSFVFASEINALLAHPEVPRRINETRVADYLARIVLNQEYTFYEEIFRLPPGHFAIIRPEGFRKKAYWTISLVDELRLESEEEYAEAFREIFSEAVACRLRSKNPVGSLLSGGLDSSSVTAMAGRLSSEKVHTFSARFSKTDDTDEGEYIQEVLQAGSYYESHFFDGNTYDPLEDFPSIVSYQSKATMAPSGSLMWMLYRGVGDAGLNVVLEGHGGDEVIAHGYGYRRQLAMERRWPELVRDLQTWNDSRLEWQRQFVKYWLRHGPVAGRFGSVALRLLNPILQFETLSLTPIDLVDHELARRTSLSDRKNEFNKLTGTSVNTERERHLAILTGPLQSEAMEELNLLGASCAIEVRIPFWDRRLIDFCLALPSEVKRKDGIGRQILRSGLKGILPETIRCRPDKASFRNSVIHALASSRHDLRDSFEELLPYLSPYVDMHEAGLVSYRFLEDPLGVDPVTLVATLQLLGLSHWIRER